MRMSCNGCRILRKGCSENCSIRPCLQWIKTSDSQANATVFLAKFYGRAGLINLLNACGPDHLRPAIFRSLLYEACGRIVNPIYGSIGLLWSGNWQLCQAAVEAVLKGAPITQITSEAAVNTKGPPLKPYDIRHVSKDETISSASADLHKVKTRCRFKKIAVKPLNPGQDFNSNRSTSHDSSVSHPEDPPTESMESGETAEASFFFGAEPETSAHTLSESPVEDDGLGLELALGIEPVSRVCHVKKHNNSDKCKMVLKLE